MKGFYKDLQVGELFEWRGDEEGKPLGEQTDLLFVRLSNNIVDGETERGIDHYDDDAKENLAEIDLVVDMVINPILSELAGLSFELDGAYDAAGTLLPAATDYAKCRLDGKNVEEEVKATRVLRYRVCPAK